jgi:hypothetical protein
MKQWNSPQLEEIIAYTIFLVLHDISCITVKVRPFLNVNEVPSIKLGHVIHLLSVHFFTDGDNS